MLRMQFSDPKNRPDGGGEGFECVVFFTGQKEKMVDFTQGKSGVAR